MRALAVGQDEERHFGPGQALLDHEAASRRRRTRRRPSPRARPPRPRRGPARSRTPLPAARPSALTTTGNPKPRPGRPRRAPSAGSSHTRNRAVGMPCARHEVLRDRPSSTRAPAPPRRARRCARPSRRNRSAIPRSSGASGPTTVRSTRFALGQGEHCRRHQSRSTGRQRPTAAMPGLPGAAEDLRRRRGPAGAARPGRARGRRCRARAPSWHEAILWDGLGPAFDGRGAVLPYCVAHARKVRGRAQILAGEGVLSLGRSEDSGRRVD